MFFLPLNDEIKHAQIKDACEWYLAQGMKWTVHALINYHTEVYCNGNSDPINCKYCVYTFWATAQQMGTRDSENMFEVVDGVERPKKRAKNWKDVVYHTQMGDLVAFHALPPELQEEIRKACS